MEVITHDESTPTHRERVEGLDVFSVSPEVVDTTSSQGVDKRQALGLIMVSNSIHAPGDVVRHISGL